MPKTNGPARPTVAFLYDRNATHNRVVLQLRLDHCHQYAKAMGWTVVGEFVDVGDDALVDYRRPELGAMCGAMARAYLDGSDVVCLVHDWDRLSRDTAEQARMSRRIGAAGGRCESVDGQPHRPNSPALQPLRTPPVPEGT